MNDEIIEKLQQAIEAQHNANEVLSKLAVEFLAQFREDCVGRANQATAAIGATNGSISRPKIRTPVLVRRAIEKLQQRPDPRHRPKRNHQIETR